MVLVNIKACLALAFAAHSVLASSPQHPSGHEACKSLGGEIESLQIVNLLSSGQGLTLDGCNLSVEEDNATSGAFFDPRMLETKTFAGNILTYGPMNPGIYTLPRVAFVGTAMACAAIGGVSVVEVFDYNSTDGSEDICMFADSSFISFWSLQYISRSILANSTDWVFRPIMEANPQTFENFQPKKTFQAYQTVGNIYYPEASLHSCTTDHDCNGTIACDKQPTSQCHFQNPKAKTGVCVSSTSDIKCSVAEDCTRDSYLALDYQGEKGYCLEKPPNPIAGQPPIPGSIMCVESKCTPRTVTSNHI